MSSKDDRLALSVVLRACAHAWHKCLSGCPYSLARAFLFARRSVASSSFLLRNVAMSQSGSQAVCRVNRRVNRTVSRPLRFVHQSQTSGRNRLRLARRSSPKKPPESKPKSTKNRSREAPGAPKIDSKSTSGRPGRFRVVPGASRSVPGAPRERPKGAPGEARGAPRSRRGSKKSAQEGPEPPQSMQNRSKVASESGKNAKLSLGRVGMITRIDFRSIFGCFSKIAFS